MKTIYDNKGLLNFMNNKKITDQEIIVKIKEFPSL